jgi:hypothetical protein
MESRMRGNASAAWAALSVKCPLPRSDDADHPPMPLAFSGTAPPKHERPDAIVMKRFVPFDARNRAE